MGIKILKKYKTFIILVFIFNLLNIITSNCNEQFVHSSLLQTLNPEKKEVLDFWYKYLYEKNDSIRINYWSKEDLKKFNRNPALFETSFFYPNREEVLAYFIPYVLSIEKNQNVFTITTMFLNNPFNLSKENIQNQNPASILKIKVIKIGNNYYLSNNLNEITSNWNKLQINNFVFIIEPNITIDTLNCKKSIMFYNEISKIWNNGIIVNDTINYYVSSTSESVNKLLGFDFAFYGAIGNGMAITKSNVLFSGYSDFFYKHEIAHFIFKEIENKLISEGLATFYGGSNGIHFENLLLDFKNRNYPIDETKLLKILEFENSKDFYILSALIIKLLLQSKDIKEIKDFINLNIREENDAVTTINTINHFLKIDDQIFFKEINLIINK